MVSLTAKSSGEGVSNVVGRFDWGEVGSPIKDSIYFRDYCYLCDEPIRVPLEKLGFPNACSFCQPDYRGISGVAEAKRLFWIRQYLDEVEVISG